MICCLPHLGPTTSDILAQDEENPGYVVQLPQKVALAAAEAFKNIEPSTFEYAEEPVKGIAYNREYEGGKTDRLLAVF